MATSIGALYRVGTVTVTQNNAVVVGVGTSWLSVLIAIAVGDLFTLDMKTWYEVIAVDSDTGIALDRNFESATAAGVSYGIIRNTSGTTNTRLAGQITKQFNQKQLLLDEWQTWANSSNATEVITDSHNVARNALTLASFEARAEASIATAESSSAQLAGMQGDIDQVTADTATVAADKAIVNTNKGIVSADRVQTGLDATATAADRVQTDLDATGTASDRVQSGLDATATAADRVQTGLDAIATAADKVSAAASLASMATLFDSFDDKFLGTKASDPALDNDSNALAVGAFYYNSTSLEIRFYNGTSWDMPEAASAASAAAAAISELNSATSETNSANSAGASLVSENNSSTSEANALSSKNSAATSAAEAASSAAEIDGQGLNKAQYFALAEQTKLTDPFNGFHHMGNHLSDDNLYIPVNQGLWTNTAASNIFRMGRTTSGLGDSDSPTAILSVGGVPCNLDSGSGQLNLSFPPVCDGTKTYDSATGAVVEHASAAEAFEGVVTNGDFRNGLTGWVSGSGISIVNGAYHMDGSLVGSSTNNVNTVVGVRYNIVVVMRVISGSGRIDFDVLDGVTDSGGNVTGGGKPERR